MAEAQRDAALRAVAKKAMERKTGARGLRTILEQVLLERVETSESFVHHPIVVRVDRFVHGQRQRPLAQITDILIVTVGIGAVLLTVGMVQNLINAAPLWQVLHEVAPVPLRDLSLHSSVPRAASSSRRAVRPYSSSTRPRAGNVPAGPG